MAKEITDKQYAALVTEIKKNPGNSERHYAEKTGIPQGQIASVLYKAELEADPKLKVPATGPGILKAKKSGLRWPRVATYAGVSVAKAKELFAEAGGKEEDAYTGRGRKTFEGGTPTRGASGRRSSTKTKSASTQGTSGRRGVKSAPAAGRRGAVKAKAAPGRRGTRAAAKSDPS